jgi:malonyl-CoA/methylmalonyl-CoA synthetase
MIDLISHAIHHDHHPAIITHEKIYSYRDLLASSHEIASTLLLTEDDLHETRVAYIVSPGFDYVAVQWGIWRAGGIAVPLCIHHPLPSLQYVIEDSASTVLVAGAEYLPLLSDWVKLKGIRLITLPSVQAKSTSAKSLPDINPDRRAMILYTSGTTNLPKGVVTTHATIQAQISSLVMSWEWSSTDHILCVLPLHHVHGIINVVCCALWTGAIVEFLPSFTAESVFNSFLQGRINVFMAVPTIYYKLIAYWEILPVEKQEQISKSLSAFRLMVSGSAALPESIMNTWKKITSHTLLERYGMTEIGMGISNPYHGERKAGYIGKALPGVSVRLADEHDQQPSPGMAGEIQIKGSTVFLEYWNKPEATLKSFTEDGWFKTGDIAIVENDYYKILGRDSIDIIKSGGYKISALEIEETLREHTSIQDCSVVGIANEEWGEIVGAVLLLRDNIIDLDQLNHWMREKLPAYKCPRKYKIVEELPRNAMGKVLKNELKEMFN